MRFRIIDGAENQLNTLHSILLNIISPPTLYSQYFSLLLRSNFSQPHLSYQKTIADNQETQTGQH